MAAGIGSVLEPACRSPVTDHGYDGPGIFPDETGWPVVKEVIIECLKYLGLHLFNRTRVNITALVG